MVTLCSFCFMISDGSSEQAQCTCKGQGKGPTDSGEDGGWWSQQTPGQFILNYITSVVMIILSKGLFFILY